VNSLPQERHPAVARFRSFRWQLALRLAVLVTGTTAGVLVAGGWLLSRQVERSIDALHEVEQAELGKIIGGVDSLAVDELERRIRQDADSDLGLYYIQVHDTDGRVLFQSGNLGGFQLPDLSGREQHETMRLPGLGTVRVSEYRGGSWHIQIASPLVLARQVLADYASVGMLILGGVALLSIVVGWAFARITLRPVGAIRETALRIRGDNLGERIPVPSGRDELAALAVLLNRMFDRLESSFSQARRFTADASHELRTPLTLIRLNAEKLRPRLAADAEGSAALGDLLDSVVRLQRIVESLLFLARAESGSIASRLQHVRTSAVVAEMVEDAIALCEDRGAHFLVRTSDDEPARCEPTLVRQLLLNLVSNAVRVSPSGGTVVLESCVREGVWSLRVTDEGPGLPPEQLQRIFERFVRYEVDAGAAATAETEERNRGHGLGLAICKSIAGLHGGSIAAENRADRAGLTVEARWPVDGPLV